MSVRTRFAPSPTGVLHLGGLRTALYNWLYARRHGGQFLLRIEDTDRQRSSEEHVRTLIDALQRFGLDFDGEPLLQSSRVERHREVADQLLEMGSAYHCYCTPDELTAMRKEQRARGEDPRYDGRCRERSEPRRGVSPVLRFRRPDIEEVVVRDWLHGDVRYRNAQLDDLVLLRADRMPTFHLSCVTDDEDMGVRQVIRGDDHLNNTPRQLQLIQALGLDAAGVLPPAAAAGAGRPETVQARCSHRRAALPAGRVSAPGGAQLPRASGLVSWRSGGVYG